MAEVSVIVATIEDREQVECIPAFERDEFDDYEVIVRSDAPVTRARNEGIRRADADKLVFLDDDSRPHQGYLAEAARVLSEEVAVAGKVIHPRDDVFGRHYTGHYSHGDAPTYVDRFWGCNMAVRREVFDAVGMWDEDMDWGHEEKELAERVIGSYDIYYDPDLVVDHCYAESLPEFWRKQYRLELMTPYYWDTQGVPERDQVGRILSDLLWPGRYVRWTIPHTIAQSGNAVAQGLGRSRGMLRKRRGN